jgi:hypothetical protein
MWRFLAFVLVAAGHGADDAASAGSADQACAVVAAADPAAQVAVPSGELPRFEGVRRVIVKAPIHNPCQSKKYPALKVFWKEVHPRYRSTVDLKAFIQPPEFLFYGEKGAFLGRHVFGAKDPVERYEELLTINGVKKGGGKG